MGEDQRGLRRARPVAVQVPPAGSRWAVVIGVSEYQDPRLNLRYAAQDAEDLAALIRTPNGGAFPDENVLLLTDGQATSREVTRALRSFLTRPATEDLVLIYLACHGGPDPRRPTGPLYLLTHDTEYADIAGTAVPMDEIDGALRGSLLSERVVVIADTCHSGDLGGAGRRSVASAEVTNRYLNRLAGSKPGVALLTSCESAESSQEDGRWGGGHGVFTWHLLEGMRGAADGFGGRERDGIVSVGELFEYVRERVRADTEGQQHPSVGAAPFDRNLPMAVTGDLDTQRHLSLARHLIELGWLTDDPAAFACAARETAGGRGPGGPDGDASTHRQGSAGRSAPRDRPGGRGRRRSRLPGSPGRGSCQRPDSWRGPRPERRIRCGCSRLEAVCRRVARERGGAVGG